jgi:hypothetical protein
MSQEQQLSSSGVGPNNTPALPLGLAWKLQFDRAKWEQRGKEMAERMQSLEKEGHQQQQQQQHNVPLPVPHPTFLVFPLEEDQSPLDSKVQEWSEWLKQHGYSDSLRVTVPNRLFAKFEMIRIRPDDREQTLEEVAHRFETLLSSRQDIRQVQTLPLPSQTPETAQC